MVEYASVRSSLYDIDSLVAQLNDKAGEGWEVVQILPTGGDVTAVLQRSPATEAPAGDALEGEGAALLATEAFEAGEATGIEETLVAEEAAVEEAALEEAIAEEAAAEEVAAEAVVEEAAVEEAVAEAAAEPAGWADAPEAAEETITEVVTDVPGAAPVVEEVAAASEPVAEPVAEAAAVTAAAAAAEPVAAAPEPAPAPAPAPTPTPPPAPAPAASIPAGWYPDPSGRFELRYWDGNAWTEHVARQGQMYTDPPVA